MIFRKIFFLTIILLTLSNLTAARETTFDDRQTCEENKGIWREFGNGCGDNCISKFDKYEICTRAITYACDCGRGRCWNEDRCLTISSYKKIFDNETAEQEKILAEKAKERQERIKKDPTLSNYLQNLYVQKDETAQNVQNQTGQTGAQSGGQNTQNNTQQTGAQPVIPDIASQPTSPITQVPSSPAITTAPDGSTQIRVPPIFMQQEQEKQKQQAAKNPAGTGTEATPPALPIIPLPQ